MKNFFLCVIALAFCAASPGCVKENDGDTVKSTWESKTGTGNLILTFIDETTCSIRSASGVPGRYDAYFGVFEYDQWFGVNQASLYYPGESERTIANARYMARYSDDTHLIPVIDGVEDQSAAIILTKRR